MIINIKLEDEEDIKHIETQCVKEFITTKSGYIKTLIRKDRLRNNKVFAYNLQEIIRQIIKPIIKKEMAEVKREVLKGYDIKSMDKTEEILARIAGQIDIEAIINQQIEKHANN